MFGCIYIYTKDDPSNRFKLNLNGISTLLISYGKIYLKLFCVTIVHVVIAHESYFKNFNFTKISETHSKDYMWFHEFLAPRIKAL